MGLLSKIKSALFEAEIKEITVRDPRWATAQWPDSLGASAFSEPFRKHGWVYACVKSIMTRVSSVPITLKVSKDHVLESGPWYDILQHPNQYWTHRHLLEATTCNLMLGGNALWVLDRRVPGAIPTEIWCFGRDKFKQIMVPGKNLVDHWEFKSAPNEEPVDLETWQVCWFPLYNPYSSFWGLAPLEAAMSAAEQDWLANIFNRTFYENCAVPGGILKIKDELLPGEQESLRLRFESRHGGADKAWRTLVLKGDMDYEQFKISHTDMNFIEQKKWGREEICACFHVPPSEVGIFERVHKATADIVQKMYLQGTIMPLHRLIEDCINTQLFPNMDKMWGEFDYSNVEALQDDYSIKVDRARKLWEMGVPFSMINQRLSLGFDAFPGDEIGYVPVNLRPLDVPFVMQGASPALSSSGESPKSPPEEPEATKRPEEKPKPEDNKALVYSVKALVYGSNDHLAYITDWIGRTADQERDFWQKIRWYLLTVKKYLFGKVKEDLDRYSSIENIPPDAWDLPEEFNTTLGEMSWKHFLALMALIGPDIERQIAESGIDYHFDATKQTIVDFLEKKRHYIVEHINKKSVNDAVERLLTDVRAGGYTLEAVNESLQAIVSGNRSRALTIARTETATAVNGVVYIALQEAGVTTVQWITAMDERVRISHTDNMQQGPWPLGKPWPNGCYYPGDITAATEEIVNCRCGLKVIS